MTQQASVGERPRVQQIIGVYDALSARIADTYGFDWLHVGGYNISGSQFAMPDVGLLTLSENLDAVRKIVNCTSRPVLVDGDDGYGNYLNVMRLVHEIERTGAAGIHMEDQVLPKKCGHMEGKRVVSTDTFVSKIKAFVDTRKSSDFLLFARTDAIAVNGFDDAIERGNRYLEAGADVIFVEAPTSMEQAAAIPKLIRGPVMYNWVFAGRSPLIHPDVLTELGYSHYLQADILYAVSHALKSYFSALKTTGTYGEAASRMITFDDFNQLVGLEKIKQAENTYEHLLRPLKPV